jgi:hypothetical protein
MIARYNSPASLLSEGDMAMTLSVLLYAMMVLALGTFAGILVVDARRSRRKAARPDRLGDRRSAYARERMRQRRGPKTAGGCPPGARPASPLAPSRSRRRATPRASCRR